MSQNIIEKLREESVTRLFEINGFAQVWSTWQKIIRSHAKVPTAKQIIDLGDCLKEIFYSTNSGRSQSEVSGGGANWEALVCWYLNICNIGRRTVCIKHNDSLIPTPISNSITVNYGNFKSNTESDLIAITFPNKQDYIIDKNEIAIKNQDGEPVVLQTPKGNYKFLDVLNALTARDFSDIEIHIIQCKTNWNDNAQIPMLWDMIYSSNSFQNNNISIGRENFNMKNAKKFTYAFATVPTVKLEKIKQSSVCVSRVKNLSGGNFWGLPSQDGIANSIKEMLNRNLSTGAERSHLETLSANISEINEKGIFSYFNF